MALFIDKARDLTRATLKELKTSGTNWESALARLGYHDRSIASLLDNTTGEALALVKGTFEASRSSQLLSQLASGRNLDEMIAADQLILAFGAGRIRLAEIVKVPEGEIGKCC